MIRSIAFTLALMFGVSASPLSQNAQKEIQPTIIDIVYAAEPCPPIIVTVHEKVAPIQNAKPVVKAKVKVKKKKRVLTKKQKKKIAAMLVKHKDKKTDHHKSKVPDHHKSKVPTNNPTTHGPLHLTSPPGCG